MFIQGHKHSSTLSLWGGRQDSSPAAYHSCNPSAAKGLGPPVAQLVACWCTHAGPRMDLISVPHR